MGYGRAASQQGAPRPLQGAILSPCFCDVVLALLGPASLRTSGQVSDRCLTCLETWGLRCGEEAGPLPHSRGSVPASIWDLRHLGPWVICQQLPRTNAK